MRAKDESSALFWCHLLHDALFGDLSREEERRFLHDLAVAEVRFPDGSLKRPSLSMSLSTIIEGRTPRF